MRVDHQQEVEQKEDRKKDERKRTQQSCFTAALARFACDHPNYTFTGSNQARLVNLKREKYGPQTIGECNYCGK